MKKIMKKYYKLCVDILKDKKIIVPLIIVTLLSYGFMLTNFSVGVDDLCLDRYVDSTYILSAGRWGTWLIYKILNINTFTPFWLEFLCVLILFITSILLIAFLKEISNSKLNKVSYIVFTLSFISFPIVTNFLVYQPTNLTICLSNFVMIFAVIMLYEKFINKKQVKLNIILLLILSLIISMYESCCQTFVVLVLLVIIFYNNFNKEIKFKDSFKFCIKCFLVLLLGIILNFIICEVMYFVLDKLNLLTENYATKGTFLIWLKNGNTLKEIIDYKSHFVFSIDNFFSVEFVVICWITLFVIIMDSICNRKKFLNILWYIFAFLANFILYFLINTCTFRVCYSWMIFIGFSLVYIIEFFKKYRKIVIILCVWIILLQTRNTNQLFYNDYKGYQRDINYANYIINKIIEECSDIKKPLLIIKKSSYKYYENLSITADVRSDFYSWSYTAFDERNTELVKFFNHLGYDFDVVEDYNKYYDIYLNLDNEDKNKDIIELDNFIVVKI